MPVDPNRASFVQQEYRFEEAADANVRSQYPTARQYVHNTNLSASAAEALADRIFAQSKNPARAFTVEVEGLYLLDTLDGGPMRFEVRSDRYQQSGRIFNVAGFECDTMENRTRFEVRG